MKKIIYILLFFALSPFLFGQDDFVPVPMLIGEDTEIWNTARRGWRSIAEGETVLGVTGPHSSWGVNFERQFPSGQQYTFSINYGNERFHILSNVLRTASGDSLPESWITPFNPPRVWVISYTLDILGSLDRNTFITHERPHLERFFENLWNDMGTRRGADMYEMFNNNFRSNFRESLVFTSTGIEMGGMRRDRFLVTDITPFRNGYSITVSGDGGFWSYFRGEYNFPILLPFPSPFEHPNFTMIFIPDGDFMDVYLDSIGNNLATFAKVDSVFLTVLNNFIDSSSSFDLSLITSWPRRADGTMDFPPPIDMSSYLTTHTTTARLRVRDNPNTASLIVTTLDIGAEVQVLETGAMATIDGITAPWVRVLSYNRFTGWVFSGFLQAVYVPVAETPTEIPVVASPTYQPVYVLLEQEQGSNNKILFIIFGVIGFLTVGILLVIFKKKKNA